MPIDPTLAGPATQGPPAARGKIRGQRVGRIGADLNAISRKVRDQIAKNDDTHWSGQPRWVADLFETVNKAGTRFWTWAHGNALGRAVISVGGWLQGWMHRIGDRLLDWKAIPAPPPEIPTDPLGPRLPAPAQPLSWLSTRGNKFVDDAGKTVRLRGVNLSGLEYSKTGDKQDAATFDRLKQLGVNIVRVPINQDWALCDPRYLETLDATLKLANDRGMYVMFDMHWYGGHQQAIPDGETLRMWRQVAHRYADQPGAIFDLHNEPQFVGWGDYAPWAEACIRAIRSVHPRSLVVVEGTQYGINLGGVLREPIRANNVAYQAHMYGSMLHGPFVGPALWDRLVGGVADRYPVIVGEWGGEDVELPYGNELLAYMDRKGMSWTAWNWGGSTPHLAEGGDLTLFGKLVAGSLARP
jgi:hypothetical protein